METVDELYDEIMNNNTKYLEIARIQHEIRNAMVANNNTISYNFSFVWNDLTKQKEIVTELEKSGFKVTPIWNTEKTHMKIKIKWDPKIIEDKNSIIMSATKAKNLSDQYTPKKLIVKEMEAINKEIKEAASQGRYSIWWYPKFIKDENDWCDLIEQLKKLGYNTNGYRRREFCLNWDHVNTKFIK